MSVKLKYDYAIVGGGVVGLLSALALSKLPVRVCLIEKLNEAQIGKDSRVVALNLASVNVLKHLNVWDEVVAKSPIKQMSVWDHMADGAIAFDVNQTPEMQLGYIIEQGALLKVLLNRVQTSGVSLYFGESINHIEQQTIVLEDKQVHCDLILGADGANSFVRESFDIKTSVYDYQQTATVATIHCQQPHLQTAYQFFHPTGPVALLPLAEPHHVSLVWSCSDDTASVHTDHSFCKSLYQHVDGILQEMTLVSPRIKFPLKRMHAKSYWHNSCVLLGDAAHMIHPLAGQGLNLGILDVATLYDCLSQWHARGKVDLPRYLNRYQRQRRAHASLLQGAMDAFHFGFRSRNVGLIGLRNWGLNKVNASQFLKKRFMDVALGKIGFTIPNLGRNYHGRAEHSAAAEANPIF